MIVESRLDLSPEGTVMRCINCGLVLDPLIQQNRLMKIHAKSATMHAA
jgi:hypothetical protein